MPTQNKTDESDSRLNALLKNIIRLGHETFSKGDLQAASVHILNNSRLVLKYDRASILNFENGKAKVIAVSNQNEINNNSEFTLEIINLVKSLQNYDKIVVLPDEIETVFENKTNLTESFDYFKQNKEKVVVVPLLKPDNEKNNEKFFWIIEFFSEFQNSSLNVINLLSLHYREAIWFYSIERKSILSEIFKHKKYFSLKKVIIYLVIILFFISFFRISQNVVADFELVPYDEVVEYAPFTGIIENVNFRNGQKVEMGESVFQYDTQELSYKLMEAKTQYAEISAELDWIKQQSFSDQRQLGKVKVLALQQDVKKIEIEKNQWYLDHANIKAKISGILSINDSEKWKGKAVKPGDELFEIVPSGKINAEVMLDENNASVLSYNSNITLYLHSLPEVPISGEILSISPKPMLTKTGLFCYIIKMKLNQVKPGFIVGMRGIARVSGDKVSIGYYLFKNILLWWRKI